MGSLPIEELKESVLLELQHWKQRQQNAYARGIFRSSLAGSPAVAKLSGLFIGFVGVALTLLIGNLGSLQEFFSIGDIKKALFCLLLSVLSGFLSLLFASFVEVTAAAERKVLEVIDREGEDLKSLESKIRELESIADENSWNLPVGINRSGPYRLLLDAYPWFIQWKFKKQYRRIRKDGFFAYKQALKNQNRQFYAAALQVIFFLLGFALLIVNL